MYEDDPFRQAEQPKPAPRELVTRPTSLQDLNLEDELLDQYTRAKQLLKDAEFDDETPLNQKAQALNSITTILAHIIKMQEDLHNLQTLTKIETTLIETLKEFPEVKEAFIAAYEGKLS